VETAGCPACAGRTEPLRGARGLRVCRACGGLEAETDSPDLSLLVERGGRREVAAELEVDPEFRERYALGRVLGCGGMGMVLLARDERTRESVAVKLLLRDGDPDASERFVREGELLCELEHPNIARVREAGRLDGHAFLAMEYLPGGTLKARLARARLALDEALAIAEQVLGGLVACHARGVVHGDLKPDNVAFDAGGRAKLTNFGIARAGAPKYASPELVPGKPATPHADVYAAGALLYEMIAGRPPQVKGEPAPLATRAPGVPAGLAALVHRALAPSPQARPASAAEMLAELAQVRAAPRALPNPAAKAAAQLPSGQADPVPPVTPAVCLAAFMIAAPVIGWTAYAVIRSHRGSDIVALLGLFAGAVVSVPIAFILLSRQQLGLRELPRTGPRGVLVGVGVMCAALIAGATRGSFFFALLGGTLALPTMVFLGLRAAGSPMIGDEPAPDDAPAVPALPESTPRGDPADPAARAPRPLDAGGLVSLPPPLGVCTRDLALADFGSLVVVHERTEDGDALRVIDARGNRPARRFELPAGAAVAVASAAPLAVWRDAGHAAIVDLLTGLTGARVPAAGAPGDPIDLSPDGGAVACAAPRGLEVWRVPATGTAPDLAIALDAAPACVTLGLGGRVGWAQPRADGQGWRIEVRKVAGGKTQHAIDLPWASGVLALARTLTCAVAARADGAVVVTGLPAGEELARCGDGAEVRVALASGGALLAWCDGDGVVHLRDPATGRKRPPLELPEPTPAALACDGTTVVAVLRNRTMVFWGDD
jgi:hypothetical protein